MTDSTDKKSKEKRNNLDVDLDAMLDEAESSLLPMNELQDDEDAIDRLLMNAGFDADDVLMQAELNKDVHVVKDVDLSDEMDDSLGFDGFGEDFNEPEMVRQGSSQTAAVEVVGLVGNSSLAPLNEPQDEVDAIDRLLMNAGFDADDLPLQSKGDDAAALEKLDIFSDFSDFNEPEMVRQDSPRTAVVEEVDEFGQTTGNSSAVVVADEVDDFFGLGDDYDELDMIQDDEGEASADLVAVNGEQPVVDEQPTDDEDAVDSLLPGTGFDTKDGLEQTGGKTDELVDDVVLSDEVDGFDESDMIQDVEVEASVSANLITPNEGQQVVVEESNVEEDVSTIEDRDDFSDFSVFNEPEMVRQSSPRTAAVEEVEESEQVTENASAHIDDAELLDEVDGFSGFGDDFDEADLIQNDEVETSALAGLITPNEGQQVVVEESNVEEDVSAIEDRDVFSDFSDFNKPEMVRQSSPRTVAVEEVEESEQVTENASAHIDDIELSDEVDGFDESDMIQDDEIKASAPAVADYIAPGEGQQVVVEESFNELQDDENTIDSLLMDAGFDEDDALEQMAGKKYEFGDDADLSEIDDFFQLDEVSDDFSKQTEEVRSAETEKTSAQDDQEDDFLLPDFDITADMEISDMGSGAGVKEDELADAFGDTDFLNEDEAVQVFEPETAELKSGGDEAVTELKSEQATDTAIKNAGNVKLSPFGLEQEDTKKQLEDAEKKVKKAKLLSYIALGFGTVALSSAIGLGVMTHGAKTEVSKLTEAVSTLEASLANSVAKNAANNPNKEINAMRDSVVQLNQQLDGFITELKENPQFPVDLLNNKVPDIVAKQDMVSKALDMLQLKVGGLEGMVPSEPFVELSKIEVAHEPAPAKEGNVHEIASVKTGAVHEPAPNKEGTAHKIVPTKERAMHETAPAKVETVPKVAPAKVKTQPEAVTPKPIIAAKTVLKEEPVKVKKQETTANWGVNLVAFKQEWYAKSKAAEFARLGVYAEVIPVHEKNTVMYRLRVGGYKSKGEAYSNTARIKKTLNLNSVWVSDN